MESDVWYPAFTLAEGADPTRFSRKYTVDLSELNAMRKLIVGPGAKKARLPPGSAIGPVRAKLPKRPTDFIWRSFSIMASQRAIDLLERAGIHIPHGPVLAWATGAATGYVALQLDPVPLYSERTLAEMTLKLCSACGHCWMQNVWAELTGPREFVQRRMPQKHGLVKSVEGGHILATEQFMEVVRSKKLTGMEFEEVGVYV
jgi:hypothetical protein